MDLESGANCRGMRASLMLRQVAERVRVRVRLPIRLKLWSLRRYLHVVIFVLAGFPTPAPAQSDAFLEAYDRYKALMERGLYPEAEPLARELAALSETEFGPMHENTAAIQYQLALLLQIQNKTQEVEVLLTRVLSIYDSKPGGDTAAAMVLSDLAKLYLNRARFMAAERAYRRILEIRQAKLGPEHPDVAATLNDLAEVHRETGRFAEAEALYRHSLAIDEAHFGPNHPEFATTLNNLALLYEIQGWYGDAEPLHRQALAIRENYFGPETLAVSSSLNNLASLYQKEGRYGEAENLLRRARAITERTAGPESRETAVALNNLAVLFGRFDRHDEAAKLYRRSLDIFERIDGPFHPNVATSLTGLAESYRKTGRYATADPLLERALDIKRRAFGPRHFETAIALNNLAALYRDQGRLDAAGDLFRSVIEIYESTFGRNHALIGTALSNMASLCEDPACYPDALELAQRATAIARDRIASGPQLRSNRTTSERRTLRPGLFVHLAIAQALAAVRPELRGALTAESFEIAQLARTTAAARSVAGMASRFAAGDDALAQLVRRQQDMLNLWQALDERLIQAAGLPPDKRDLAGEKGLRELQAELGGDLDELEQKLAREFPEYAEIANPQPLTLSDAQSLLGPDEALVSYSVSDAATFIHLVLPDQAVAFRVDMDRSELNDAVVHLRGQLTPTGLYGLADLLDRGYDAQQAHKLYQRLFAPLERHLEVTRHIFLVLDGALQSLPLGVLLTERPEKELTDFADFRAASWLARRFAMTTLPAASSLRALRKFARSSKADKPFFGFGDPALEGSPGGQRGVEVGALFRGALADVRAVRRLSRLPDSADELRMIAASLDAGEDSIFLGQDMTEERIKSADLANRRVLAFATHGLVAGEIRGAAEPALVFTPPLQPSPENDGLLTASEIARHLELDADLVILSACNTAAGQRPGAEGLSGLAKAFFYAGSRALLVSHWPVSSQAAVQLTTGMFKELALDPHLGRAESLRRSMLAMIEDRSRSYFAHPLFWAPFVLVGEGGSPLKVLGAD